MLYKRFKKQLPCAQILTESMVLKNVYAGVPIIIGKNGVEKIIELNLSQKEKEAFALSVKAVQDLYKAAQKIDPNL